MGVAAQHLPPYSGNVAAYALSKSLYGSNHATFEIKNHVFNVEAISEEIAAFLIK
ncbi:hypothetical protein Pmar_PMAR002301 [Perkinsus marinus ATCC 50983]|uniref:Uncharacterized protein n=1 Tax=Perkinsus marinus (strain ATCC 50983 / TXsc) TaxID=423536 RepID=C5KUY3_PERM5|nr:hypothetical protein Pmar_PMAR002301 [Perkinsus marinus ATCC 50983]EER11698.1 hypothetical protein Pmar_PMAR002301 [Perkinsus marinus ATCC 50983]|eukprot:XP_002779903.1 hypothetical protein Pmar_PMAR002301 [Perkinsus marinus ATCC 50983]